MSPFSRDAGHLPEVSAVSEGVTAISRLGLSLVCRWGYPKPKWADSRNSTAFQVTDGGGCAAPSGSPKTT